MTVDEDREFTWGDHVGAINLFVRLFAELAIMVALGFWGWRAADSTIASVASAVTAPLAWAIVWGALVAPKAKWRLPDPVRFVVEMALFVGVAFALSAVDLPVIGITLGALAALTSLLMIPFRQRGK